VPHLYYTYTSSNTPVSCYCVFSFSSSSALRKAPTPGSEKKKVSFGPSKGLVFDCECPTETTCSTTVPHQQPNVEKVEAELTKQQAMLDKKLQKEFQKENHHNPYPTRTNKGQRF